MPLQLHHRWIWASVWVSGAIWAAPLPQWSYPLPGPSWAPAADVVPMLAAPHTDVFEGVLVQGPQAWREVITANGNTQRSGPLLHTGLGHTSVFLASPDPYLAVNYRGVDVGGPGPCSVQRNHPDLSLAWFRTFVDTAPCRMVLTLQDGGALVADFSRLVRLAQDGTTRWELTTAQLGGWAADAIETSSGRVLLFGNMTPAMQVRDGLSGTLLASQPGPERLLAFRASAGGHEGIGLPQPGMPVEVLRWSDDGAPQPGYTLPAFAGAVQAATAHAQGFVLAGAGAEGELQIRYYDGNNLRWIYEQPDEALAVGSDLVERDGQVVTVLGDQRTVLRLDRDGLAMPAITAYPRLLRFDAAGALWMLRAGFRDGLGADRKVERYLPHQAIAQFTHALRIPTDRASMLAFEAGQDGTRHAGSLFADSPSASTSRLLLHDLDPEGMPRHAVNQSWSLRALGVGVVAGGWVVLSAPASEPIPDTTALHTLTGLDAHGQILWQREMTVVGGIQLGCNGVDRCAVLSTGAAPAVEVFDGAGQTLHQGLLDSDMAWELLGKPGTLLALGRGEVLALHALTDPALPRMARMPLAPGIQVGVLSDQTRLLATDTAGLSAWAMDTRQWLRADLADVRILGATPQHLHVLQYPESGTARLLRLNPDTGTTVAQIDLPGDTVNVQVDQGPPEASILGNCACASDTDGAIGLVTTTPSGIPRLLHWDGADRLTVLSVEGSVLSLRAHAGRLYAAVAGRGPSGVPELVVRQWQSSLYRNGFEAP